ncbi:MAG: hypothetical protein AAFR79_20850 [Pseudomonadota bacterium]
MRLQSNGFALLPGSVYAGRPARLSIEVPEGLITGGSKRFDRTQVPHSSLATFGQCALPRVSSSESTRAKARATCSTADYRSGKLAHFAPGLTPRRPPPKRQSRVLAGVQLERGHSKQRFFEASRHNQ